MDIIKSNTLFIHDLSRGLQHGVGHRAGHGARHIVGYGVRDSISNGRQRYSKMSWLLCHYCRSPDSSDVGCIGGQLTSNNDTGARVTVDRSVELPGICWFATNFY